MNKLLITIVMSGPEKSRETEGAPSVLTSASVSATRIKEMVVENVSPLTGSPGWGHCPADMLMAIFKELDSTSLLNCMAVNEWWRDIVDYVAQHYDLWPELAKAGMLNEGVTYRKKSSPNCMNWRDLYINSCLWHHANAAQIKWSNLCRLDDIKSIHVYKGFLIIQHGSELNRKYYKIGDNMVELQAVPKTKREEGPIARAVRTENEALEPDSTTHDRHETDHTVQEPGRMILKIVKEGPFKRFIAFDDDCYYVLDDKNILRCFKWDPAENIWQDKTLARYFGCKKSISDIHISHDDVYMLLKGGNVMRLDREGRNFEMLFGLDFPPQTLAYFARMFYSNIPMKKIETAFKLDIPEYSTGKNVMFHKFSAVVAVPGDKQFKVNWHDGSEHVVLECPNLTCATEHGDILFLGYKDGRVDICLSEKLIRNGYVPELSVSVQNSYQHIEPERELSVVDADPAIVGLEVYELKESHYLFIATSTNVYRLAMTYPDYVRCSLSKIQI